MKAWAGIILQPYFHDQFLQIDEVYEDLACAQKAWIASTGISCVPNCGVCCKEYYPDVTEQEALYTAVCILFEHWNKFSLHETFHIRTGESCEEHTAGSSTLHANSGNTFSVSNILERIFPHFNADAAGCPFRSCAGPHFCMIYSGRPLICRLFGAAGDRSKDGNVRYSPCKVLKGRPGQFLNNGSQYSVSTSQSISQELPQHAEIPIMSDYAMRLQGYENLSKIKPLVISAIEKILFYIQVRGDRPINPSRAA